MSYFVSGGVDLSGVSKRSSLPQQFDDAETISSGEVNIFTDPRLNRLDVVDIAQQTHTFMQEELAKTEGRKHVPRFNLNT